MNGSLRRVRTDRSIVLDWVERGAIPQDRVPEALAVAGVTPSAGDWRLFLDRLLLWCGAAALGAGLIFFIAFNWTALGRFTRFGLVQAVIVMAAVAAVRLGVDRTAGKAALLVASLAAGALLALFGQTYQTGADTFELFASWGALILPWILVARFAPLWMLWLLIINLALALYFVVFPNVLGLPITGERQAWASFLFNAAAWTAWELAARRLEWLNERWAIRVLALATGILITALAAVALADWSGQVVTILVYLGWLAAAYAIYRRVVFDLFVIAGVCLSVIVTVTTFLAVNLLDTAGYDEAVLLLIAAVVIGMTAGAATWLRRIASEAA